MDRDAFEKLFSMCRPALERFVYYKTPSKSDGDDVLQEVAISAYKHMHAINNPASFKPWILRIAANKCNDFFRNLAKRYEIPFDEMADNIATMNHYGISNTQIVRDTLRNLSDKDKQVLYLYYFKNKPQAEIASLLQIPPVPKGEKIMRALPEIMPEYKIMPSSKAPFDVRWEELVGWFIIPKLGEKITWAMYDFPERKRAETTVMEVIGKASIHGIEGVEIVASEQNPRDFNATEGSKTVERRFIAQLTDTHCRYLAESHFENGIRKCFTFLDDDDFISNWGFGVNNCGKEVNLTRKGVTQRNGNDITCAKDQQLMDVVGCYDIEMNGKRYETTCLVDIELYNTGVFSEQYIDKNGKTVLWRRFNKNDWHFKQYNALWAEMMPANEKVFVNGDLYVHWYDCLTDYIL